MEQCPNCGFKDDPILDREFANKKLREFTSGDVLARTLNIWGWNKFEVRPVLDEKFYESNRTWRLQTFVDWEGEFVIALHNGKEWVAAWWNGSNEYLGFSTLSGVSVQGPAATDHLKSFEPAE